LGDFSQTRLVALFLLKPSELPIPRKSIVTKMTPAVDNASKLGRKIIVHGRVARFFSVQHTKTGKKYTK
jgi:hypothetical protein